MSKNLELKYSGTVWSGFLKGKHYEIWKERKGKKETYFLYICGEIYAESESYLKILDELEWTIIKKVDRGMRKIG